MAVNINHQKHLAARRSARLRRQKRGRKKIFGYPERPRLVVTRSARHMVAQVIDDVAGGKSDLGVLFQTSATADEVNAALDAAGLEFVELIQSAPRVALPKSHPMVNASSLSLEDMEDFPYLYFEQDEDSPVAFAEEALASVPRAKSIACTDRASLSELIVALNGYTVTSGILVGISDGAGLNTVPLDTDVKLHLGYVVRKGEALSDIGQRFVDTLKKNLEKYARF